MKWFIPVLVILIVALTTGAVFAVTTWVAAHLTTTGTVTVTAAPTYTFTVSSGGVLSFGNTNVAAGTYFEAYASISITNTGNQPITGLSIPRTSGDLPAGVTGLVPIEPTAAYPIDAGETATINFILSGTPTTTGIIDLSGITVDIIPQ